MCNMNRISRKIEKEYKKPEDNIYSYRFYTDLFSGYAYSLGETNFDKNDFFRIVSSDKSVENIFNNDSRYSFSYELEQMIDKALYSLAVFGKAYIYIEPRYIETKDKNGKTNKELYSLKINEVKGIWERGCFYFRTYSNEISKFNTKEGTLIFLDLKELGYKRSYFTHLVKKIGMCDITSSSLELLNEKGLYDFNIHLKKSQKLFFKYVSDIGWKFGTDGMSDSYIIYKEIKVRLFKIKFLKYILEKINKGLYGNYIKDDSFKIEAAIRHVDYEKVWRKFQKGELVVSDMIKILWENANY